MNSEKTGKLILKLRKEKGMTQKQLADILHLSDKTISKWERGQGSPDISLLEALAKVMSINVEHLLQGDLDPNDTDGGNMKRIKFYVCPDCGNVLTATAPAEIACCGRKLSPLEVKAADEKHQPALEKIENDYYAVFNHPMTKDHYFAFAAWVTYDQVLLMRLYPEQAAELRFPQLKKGKLYLYCSRDGLMECGINL